MGKTARTKSPWPVSAYVAHRRELGLPGANTRAVTTAIRTGRLSECIVVVGGYPKIVDMDLADEEWISQSTSSSDKLAAQRAALAEQRANAVIDEECGQQSDSRSRFDPGDDTLLGARKRLALAQAMIQEMALARIRSEVVPIEPIVKRIGLTFAHAKQRLLSIPTTLQQRYSIFTDGHINAIDEILKETLLDLSAGDIVDKVKEIASLKVADGSESEGVD